MFGADPLWGQQQPVNVGGASPYPMLPQQQLPQMPQVPQQRGGMFGGGGKLQIDLGAALAGYLAGSGAPGGAQMLQIFNERRRMAMEHQQQIDDYNRKRQDDNSDWQTRYNYELQNPKEGVGSEYERLLAAAGIMPGTPAYQQHVNAKVAEMEDPVVMTLYGPMTRSQALQMGGGQPAAPGVTFTPLPTNGGPASPAPATFPR